MPGNVAGGHEIRAGTGVYVPLHAPDDWSVLNCAISEGRGVFVHFRDLHPLHLSRYDRDFGRTCDFVHRGRGIARPCYLVCSSIPKATTASSAFPHVHTAHHHYTRARWALATAFLARISDLRCVFGRYSLLETSIRNTFF